MLYRFAPQTDQRDLASGRVLRSAPGYPAFPVRLASEIFQVALEYIGNPQTVDMLDPCCGSGYLLSILGLIHPNRLNSIVGIDIDSEAVRLAQTNLALLRPGGLQARMKELESQFLIYGRESYREAIQSASNLAATRPPEADPAVHVIQADATDSATIAKSLGNARFDIIIADIPYGHTVSWKGLAATIDPIKSVGTLLDATSQIVRQHGIWVIITPSRQRIILPTAFKRLRRQRLGHREIHFLQRQ